MDSALRLPFLMDSSFIFMMKKWLLNFLSWLMLNYIDPADFVRYGSNARVYTVTQKAESEWIIEIKPYPARMYNYKLKIHYNRGLQFDLDDELYIPDNYVELLIVALGHKFTLMYPRLDDQQISVSK